MSACVQTSFTDASTEKEKQTKPKKQTDKPAKPWRPQNQHKHAKTRTKKK
jgi:hypothetical protein